MTFVNGIADQEYKFIMEVVCKAERVPQVGFMRSGEGSASRLLCAKWGDSVGWFLCEAERFA